MTQARILGMVLALALVGALAPTAATADPSTIVRETHVVDTKHGKIYLEVARPEDEGRMVKGPAILTYSPYSVIFAGLFGHRTFDADRWVPKGYVRVWADVVGTGDSGGCWDYGGNSEKETGHAIVEWIARQPWSTGKVAMMGGSYNGTTAIATAVTDPPHLTTIIPEAAISRWYEYSYSGGIRYFWNNEAIGHQGPGSAADEGFDTPLAFDFGLAVPPPIDVTAPGWQERVASTIAPCDEVKHTQHGYDDTPDYDAFWRERDYIKDAGNIDVPVLLAHNWGDWNVKQEEAWNLFRALRNSPKVTLFMGSRWKGHDTPGGAYDRTVERWLDHFLMGKRRGIKGLPPVISERSTSTGSAKWHRGDRPSTRRVSLIAQQTVRTSPADYPWKLLPHPPNLKSLIEPAEARWPVTNTNTEVHANHHSIFNHEWFWFETPPLARSVRIFGEPKVKVRVSGDREWVTLTPTLVDVDPDSMVMAAGQHAKKDPKGLVSVTRGFLDSRYRKGLDRQVPMKPGKATGMTVVQKPQDYTFKKGHKIGLNIQSEILEWAVPKAYPCTSQDCLLVRIHWEKGKTRLILPVVGGPKDPSTLFAGHAHHG